jgi:3-hydroxyacyl-CoA dehydrogenase
LNKAVLDADLVIEAVVENLRVKQELFRKLEQICPKLVICKSNQKCAFYRKTIFATNTSSLLIKNIAKDMKDPSRFGGLHFFYPVPINEIVEVIKGENTSDNTFHRLVEFCREIKKIPIRCKVVY